MGIKRSKNRYYPMMGTGVADERRRCVHDIGSDLSGALVKQLKNKELKISIADCCTDGFVTNKLKEAADLSSVFEGDIVGTPDSLDYEYLGVSYRVLDYYGYCNHRLAVQMAVGINRVKQTDVGIAIVGIADYKDRIEGKPVGLVYAAINYNNWTHVNKYEFGEEKTKEEICELIAENTFAMALNFIEEGGIDGRAGAFGELSAHRNRLSLSRPKMNKNKLLVLTAITMIIIMFAVDIIPLLLRDETIEDDQITEVTEPKKDIIQNVETEPIYSDEITCDDEQINEAKEIFPLEGKRIVFLGDSLIGRTRDESSAVYIAADKTGAEMYNVGFGGSCMGRVGHGAFSYFSLPAITDAIISGDWSNQEANVTAAVGWDEQLPKIKSIDFSTVDIVVIHYGTNDFMVPHTLEGNEISTVCGALRYSLNRLSNAYPKLKFCISLPVYRYWGSEHPDTYTNPYGAKLTDYIEGIRSVAQEYGLPVIDGFYGMGIDKNNAHNFLEDETHHNRTGRMCFGEFIASCLIDYYKDE